jgi:hypothetical protein
MKTDNLETENIHEHNCYLSVSFAKLLHWGKTDVSSGWVDDFKNPGKIAIQSDGKEIEKVSVYLVAFIKYAIPLLLIYTLGSFSTDYVYFVSGGLAGIAFLTAMWLYRKFERREYALITIAVVPAFYLAMTIIDFEMVRRYEIGLINNIYIQYVLIWFVFHRIYNDVAGKIYDRYYRLTKGSAFEFVRIFESESTKDYLFYKYGYFKWTLGVITAIMIVLGVIGAMARQIDMIEAELAKQEMIEKYMTKSWMRNTNKMNYLDGKAKEYGFAQIHRMGINIDKYAKIRFTNSCELVQVGKELKEIGKNEKLIVEKGKDIMLNGFMVVDGGTYVQYLGKIYKVVK